MPNATNCAASRTSAVLSRIVQSTQQTKLCRPILLTTHDRDAALHDVVSAADAHGAPLHHMTVSERRRYNPAAMRWVRVGGGTPDPSRMLQSVSELKEGGVVIIEDMFPFLADANGSVAARDQLRTLLWSENERALALVFLERPGAESSMPAIMADRFVRLQSEFPREPELFRIACEELAAAFHRASAQVAAPEIRARGRDFSSALVGLTRSGARDAMRDALVARPIELADARRYLEERKAAQLNTELAMNVLDPANVDEPVGIEYLLEHVHEQLPNIRRHGKDRPRGIVIVGPPGTGKTVTARAVGKAAGLPVVEFRVSALMNSLLGATEQLFARAFATFDAMAPVVVFIDEIEKAFGDSSERDGGTMKRVTGSLLSWLADNPYPCYIVATCNSVEAMGEMGHTMTRSERFDAAFFLDVPSIAARRQMLSAWLSSEITPHEAVAEQLSHVTEKFSGADLRSVVKRAKAQAARQKVPLSLDLLLRLAEKKRSRAIAMYDRFHELRRWGHEHCEPAGPTD